MRIRIVVEGRSVEEYEHDAVTPVPHARDVFGRGERLYYVAWRFIESAPPTSPLVVLHCGRFEESPAQLRGES